MNRILIISVFTFLTISMAHGQQITGRLSTSFYAWEKYDTANQSDMLFRLNQTIQLEAAHGPLSFRTYLTGITGNSSGAFDGGRIRLYNAVLRWSKLAGLADINVGRIPVFAGVGTGTVDGLMIEGRASKNRITFKGFGGMNVGSGLLFEDNIKLKDNFSVGGQVAGWISDKVRAGISYINRRQSTKDYYAIRPDSLYNPYTVLVKPPLMKEHFIGIDILYDVERLGSFYGRMDYDFSHKNVQRVEVNANIGILENLAVTGTVIHREPRVFYQPIFYRFETESIQEYEGGVEYTFCPWASSFGRVALVKYEDDDGKRLTAGVSTNYGSFTAAWTDGAVGSLTSFSFDGMYPVIGRVLVPTVGFSYSTYKYPGSLSKREDALAGILGMVVRPFQVISFDVQVQWLRNRIYGHDIRTFGKVSYWFSESFSKHGQKEGE